jgi:hypothetical protein
MAGQLKSHVVRNADINFELVHQTFHIAISNSKLDFDAFGVLVAMYLKKAHKLLLF